MDNVYVEQTKILLEKNLIIKKRNKRKTAVEILLPIYFVFGLVVNGIVGQVFNFVVPGASSNLPVPVYKNLDLNGKMLAYSPDTAEVKLLISQLQLNESKTIPLQGLKQLEALYLNDTDYTLMGAYHFPRPFSEKQIEYYILNLGVPSMENPYYTTNQLYLSRGYMNMEVSLIQSIINMMGGRDIELNITATEFPTLQSTLDLTQITYLMPMQLPMIFLLVVQQLATLMVTEKEKKVHEALRIMGMKQICWYVSWFITQGAVLILSLLLVLSILFFSKVIHYSSIVGVFVIFLMYGFACYIQAFIVTVFTSKPRIAGVVSSLILLISLGLWGLMYFFYPNPSMALKIPLYLVAGVPFGNFVQTIAVREHDKTGLLMSDPFFWQSFGIIFMDILIYICLLWYCDNIYAGEYGLAKPWYFIFDKKFWTRKSNEESVAPLLQNAENEGDNDAGVKMVKLCKTFNKKIKAVNNLTLQVERGEILALLGQNGAGKTTVIHVLTGFLPPTSGDITVMGMDYRTHLDDIRKVIGYCPQHNILLDQLTCAEHLRLFGRIKGLKKGEVEEPIKQLLAEVELSDKADSVTTALSGGMKRKLSMSLAFIGGSSLIFLDECTSGMDPYSRRLVWKILQRYKKEKTIILTTHFMEEAELLGDHIAIMAHGKLRCEGTILQLKNQFNIGYVLRVVKIHEHVNMDPMFTFIQSIFPESTQVPSPSALEAIYSIPNDTSRFAEFFEQLQARQDEFNVKSFGLSMTTLEEVFLKISVEAELEEAGENGVELSTISTSR